MELYAGTVHYHLKVRLATCIIIPNAVVDTIIFNSLRWLKRKFKAMGLVRKNFQDPSRHVLKRILKVYTV